MKKTVLLALLFALFALPAAAQPPAGDGEPGPVERLAARLLPPPGYLDLSEDQRLAVRDLLVGLATELGPVRQAIADERAVLADLLAADAPDATAVGEAVIAVDALRAEQRTLLEGFDTDLVALLDGEQQIRWQAFKELRRHYRDRRPGGAAGEAPAPGDA